MIMDTTLTGKAALQQAPAYALMKRGKRGAAAVIAAECCNIAAAVTNQQDDNNSDEAAAAAALVRCKLLDNMLDILLNPYDAIGEWNNLDWIRWLMAGGKTLDEFISAVKDYDYGTCCGLVWTANYVAYRCRTCSISPCMSLCGECFKRGDHVGHDFNMFRSQAGGACDCGDTSVMKPEGFCRKHTCTNNVDGSSASNSSNGGKKPPADLLSVAEKIMPRLLLRLVQYLRENSKIADSRIPVNTQNITSGVAGASGIANQQQQSLLLIELEPFLGMLHELSALGAAMRRVMTVSLTNEKIYQWACDYYTNSENELNESSLQQQQDQQGEDDQQHTIYSIYTDKVRRYYAEAIHQYTSSTSSSNNRRRRHTNTSNMDSGDVITNYSGLSNSEDDDEDEHSQDDWLVGSQNNMGRKNKLNHSSFLQEIVFWTVRYEFPQKMVCLLLHMLPDAAYKEALTEAFVMHYGCVARVLATTKDSDTLSNHIVHISVQLFSNEALATRMVDKLGLLRVMVSSLRRMMTKILIPSTLHEPIKSKHRVVDCSKAVMKEHCYWPLVSDLNNVLSHRPIAVKFMSDERLLHSWFSYLSMFQGMNVNCRELGHHVEFEPNTYYAAFSAELEASAYPMWAMLSHLMSVDTKPLTLRVLHACLHRLRKWLIDVGYYYNQCQSDVCGGTASSSNYNINQATTAIIRRSDDRYQFTFHLPLHRYFAVFLCQAVRAQGARVEDVIPRSSNDTVNRDALLLAIASHPVRAQAAFYEIMQGAWVRNGLQIKGQAMTYIQSNFCISMVDADIYLLQLCLSELSDANTFMSLILEKFKAYDWMQVIKHGGLPQVMDSEDYDAAPSMESLLVFLTTLVGVRTNLCSDEDYDYCQSQLEMVTLLCVSDKTHSQLMELMPERCGSGTQTTTTTTSTSASSDGTSQNLPTLPLQEPSTPRDFETVLQAVAEYKRPQFEASGNMQQGLYVPLAHVWRTLFDPVHVLLRAVHRRDFQSSMDRYTAFMRSIGLLKQNQTPWPPFKTPQKHHPAYRDPRRALLSRLFHAVTWHCLYRSSFHRDVSEHTLSLLIYLLDQAWMCYSSSVLNDNKTNFNPQYQPMDIDPSTIQSSGECSYNSSKMNTNDNISPKQRIKITAAEASSYCDIESDKVNNKDNSPLLLDRWYNHDDLVYNLCTTITHIELPPPFYHYYFGTTSDDTTNTTAASTMATNLFDYFTSSVAAAAAAASSSTATSHNTEPGNSLTSNVPSLIEIAGNGIPVIASLSNLPRPPFYSLNAAAAATSSTMADSALNCVKQHLQFLRPPHSKTPSDMQQQQQLSSEQEQTVVDIDTSNTSHNYNFENMRNDDINEATDMSDKQHYNVESDKNHLVSEINDNLKHSLVPINESIISLLLKLHSQLSAKPDSYQPPSINETMTNESEPTTSARTNDHHQEETLLCGDGAYYVGRLLDKIVKGSTSCYKCVVRTRLELWPQSVVMRETASREDEERERRERKRRARDKQQQMMEEMARAQRAFLESARRSGDLDSTDTQSTSSIIHTTIMECDESVTTVETSTANTSNSNINTSSVSHVGVDIDENSSSSNSTTKESVVGVSHLSETDLTVDCVICNQTVVVHMEQQRQDPVGLVILVQGTNILAHRRHILSPLIDAKNQYIVINSNTENNQKQQLEIATTVVNSSSINNENVCVDEDEQNYYRYWPALPPLKSQQNNQQSEAINENSDLQPHHLQSIVPNIIDDDDTTTYASHSDRRKRLMTQYFNNLDKADLEIGALTTTTSSTAISGNVHVQTCGHHLHLRCWSSYLASLRGTQRFNSDRGEYSCPLCRQLANSLMPLMPVVVSDQQYSSTSFNTAVLPPKVIMTDSMRKLTELIKQQESDFENPSSPSSNTYSGDSSVSVITSNHQQQQQLIHQRNFHNDGYVPDPTHEDSVTDNNVDVRESTEESTNTEKDPFIDAINRCVCDMITSTVAATSTQPIPLQPALLTATLNEKMDMIKWHNVVSVAWTNLQVELVQRNNSLLEQQQEWSPLHGGFYCQRHHKCFSSTVTAFNTVDTSGNNDYYNMLPKRNCIAQLLKVLRVCAQSLMMKHQKLHFNPLNDIWYKLMGMEKSEQQYINTHPPLLMRDPCSILLQLVLLLPTMERDVFDTLVKLTYNMQLFAAALKVAITWNHNCNYNRHHRPSLQLYGLRQQSKEAMTTDETCTDGSNTRMDLDNDSNDITFSSCDNTSQSSSFSNVVALAKTIVFLSQNDDEIINIDGIVNDEDEFTMHHDDYNVSDNKSNIPTASSEDSEENLLLLESYGRKCTLPFLRFAALLKKYTYGNDDDNLNIRRELSTLLSQQQQKNLHLDQHKQKEQILDIPMQDSYHHDMRRSFLSRKAIYKNEGSINNLSRRRHVCRNRWSRDDYEFLTLARYLKLLNNTVDHDKVVNENCDCCEENYECNCYVNDDHNFDNIKIKPISLQPPSAMDAVTWPHWAYSVADNKDNIAMTTISLAWLTSFREALTTKIPRGTIVCDNITTTVSSAAAEIDPNSNSTTSANIIMAARLLLAVDCCDGGNIINSVHQASDSGSAIISRDAKILPTINWTGPRLLRLPDLYDDVFQYYHGRPCHRCHSVPRETSVCLACGTLVCLKENCCTTNGIYEAVQHSLECGGGTGVFLVVTSSSVVVIRGKRACLWGSVYLDVFGEEDRELKRGKPLYLSAERYRLLERQWLAHRFDHTNKKWVWHRDAL